MAARYFEGIEPLLYEQKQGLASRTDFWRVLVKLFNDLVVEERRRTGGDAPPAELLEPAKVEFGAILARW